jgi:hypothetical protein
MALVPSLCIYFYKVLNLAHDLSNDNLSHVKFHTNWDQFPIILKSTLKSLCHTYTKSLLHCSHILLIPIVLLVYVNYLLHVYDCTCCVNSKLVYTVSSHKYKPGLLRSILKASMCVADFD